MWKLLTKPPIKIAEITRQVKHLAVQAGLIASRSGQQMAGFDFISEAINKLANQVVFANQQVEEMANHFRHHIREVVQSTASGEKSRDRSSIKWKIRRKPSKNCKCF